MKIEDLLDKYKGYYIELQLFGGGGGIVVWPNDFDIEEEGGFPCCSSWGTSPYEEDTLEDALLGIDQQLLEANEDAPSL